jgi:hypothetical protein
MEHIRAIVQPELDWEDARWQAEVTAYSELLKHSYRL